MIKTISHWRQQLDQKKISSVELTREYLDTIAKRDEKINAFVSVTESQALSQASAADEVIAQGKATALTGIPMAHKDIFCTEGVKTSCGSKMLDNFIAPYSATVVNKLNANGSVMLGKLNMDEFAMGSSNESSFYGPTRNPWDTDRVPGGSSGGSAAAVAMGMAPFTTATDTGGSIRQPAAFCGVTGIKPTYGSVSRYGMIAFASSLDQGGVIAHTAEDCAHVLNAMTGFDEKDSTSVQRNYEDFTAELEKPLSGLCIGLPKEYFSQQADPALMQCVDDAVKQYESLGATIKEISLPNSKLSVAAYYVIAPAECSSNLSRFDGVRFGHRCDDPKDLEDLYKRSRAEGFGDEVKRRIMIGTYSLSAGYFDAYYVKAQKVRRLISQDFDNAFKDVDVILSPTTPTPAFKIGEKIADPVTMYLSDIYTIAVNLAGLPGVSIPAGFVNNLPVGVQLIGSAFSEARLLQVAHQYQQVTDWHLKEPAIAEQE